jgi:hypothetical protein
MGGAPVTGKTSTEETPSASTPVDLFGSNSDGGIRMSEWLDVMCKGCKHESVQDRKHIGGGCGCELVSRAICDPNKAQMPEWMVLDPVPEGLTDALGKGPWPVCGAYEKRTTRSDKGLRRGPRKHEGQALLFEEAS